MKAICRGLFISLLLTPPAFYSAATGVRAEDAALAPRPSAAASEQRLTGKERLGPKWSDEQRIDNCRVPVDKRGPRIRPNACSTAPSS
jgi:hypothetical protein